MTTREMVMYAIRVGSAFFPFFHIAWKPTITPANGAMILIDAVKPNMTPATSTGGDINAYPVFLRNATIAFFDGR